MVIFEYKCVGGGRICQVGTGEREFSAVGRASAKS